MNLSDTVLSKRVTSFQVSCISTRIFIVRFWLTLVERDPAIGMEQCESLQHIEVSIGALPCRSGVKRIFFVFRHEECAGAGLQALSFSRASAS